MSTVLAPPLELPSTQTQQMTVTETTPSQAGSPKEDFLPQSVTFTQESLAETHGGHQMFGTHIREAISIFKDWLGE